MTHSDTHPLESAPPTEPTHPSSREPRESRPASWRESCAKCGYDTTPMPASEPCPECGAHQRTLPFKPPLIGMRTMKPTLIIQAIGGLCCLAASIWVHVPQAPPSPSGYQATLTVVGAMLCLFVGPTVAVALGYAGPYPEEKVQKHRRAWEGLDYTIASGLAAILTGVMLGAAGCSVAWM